ncbi:hypothetical protein SELR_13820 [Selenomonas ruminantium subsp. lactilytica TAM6421]|uniref:Protein kinase domain-containing protein n=1 Tax=Selenomonas ruminantium subsp. lactilytica (strain NBRC 103574 / TAM6421) TaxID=927704 RepID=I0GQQ3_SELRL|nr:serine/threonine-protein kinase [Selenomonas ruminantium]BAL83090.1 hypothetical protein SELR_13820 [Selenomonas ruminantium subsp. lactilytica TAM6421]
MEITEQGVDGFVQPTECVDEFKHKYRLLKEIARGGQGAVYRTHAPRLVIKLELSDHRFVQASKAARDKYLSLRLLPIPKDLPITLPLAVLEKYSGYVMRLMDDMISFRDAFNCNGDDAPIENEWLENIATQNQNIAIICCNLIKHGGMRRFWQAYMKTACLLARLHEVGLVYCDFSANNVFISDSQEFCNVWLIDADNLDFEENTCQHRVWTPGIGAPEIIDEYVAKGCTFYSDCYAFAATLFQQLTHHHPFEGELFDEQVEELDDIVQVEYLRDCGEYPWVFDTTDDSNIWSGDGDFYQNLIPPRLMALLNETFSAEEGLFHKQRRPSMAEWAYSLARSLDETVRCPKCQMERYGKKTVCPWCDHEHPLLTITSYSQNGEIWWQLAHEIELGQNISIPLRLVNGFKVREIDEVAFTMQWTANGIYIHKTKESLSIEFADRKMGRVAASGFETTEDTLYIYCLGNGNTAKRIEVRLIK